MLEEGFGLSDTLAVKFDLSQFRPIVREGKRKNGVQTGYKLAGGEWRVESGEWRVESGE